MPSYSAFRNAFLADAVLPLSTSRGGNFARACASGRTAGRIRPTILATSMHRWREGGSTLKRRSCSRPRNACYDPQAGRRTRASHPSDLRKWPRKCAPRARVFDPVGRVAVRLQNRCHDPASSAPTTTYDDGDPRLTDLLTELDRESPELARVARAWPALPPDLKAAVVAIIETATRNQSATQCK